MNINTLPIVVSAIGLKTTLDIVSTGFSTLKTSTSALIACRHPHKDIASFLAKSDLLFKFTIMKSFVDEIDYQNTVYVNSQFGGARNQCYLSWTKSTTYSQK
jgi:hypothetical protein